MLRDSDDTPRSVSPFRKSRIQGNTTKLTTFTYVRIRRERSTMIKRTRARERYSKQSSDVSYNYPSNRVSSLLLDFLLLPLLLSLLFPFPDPALSSLEWCESPLVTFSPVLSSQRFHINVMQQPLNVNWSSRVLFFHTQSRINLTSLFSRRKERELYVL